MSLSEVFFTDQFWCPVLVAGGVACIAPAGELDVATIPTLDAALLLGERHADIVVLDLRELDFVDSRGAALLTRAARRIRGSGGRFVLEAMPEHIERMLRAVAGEEGFQQ